MVAVAVENLACSLHHIAVVVGGIDTVVVVVGAVAVADNCHHHSYSLVVAVACHSILVPCPSAGGVGMAGYEGLTHQNMVVPSRYVVVVVVVGGSVG